MRSRFYIYNIKFKVYIDNVIFVFLSKRTNWNYSKWALVLLSFGAILIIAAPYVLTSYSFINFTETGQIGDTIGGITAPITVLIGSILVFFALQAQIDANRLVQKQIEDQRVDDAKKKQQEYISELYRYFVKSIDDFRFFKKESLGAFEKQRFEIIETSGSDAIENFMMELRYYTRDAHIDKIPFDLESKYTEFISILDLGISLIEKLRNGEVSSDDRKFFKSLIEHQFNFRIHNTFREIKQFRLNDNPCPECGVFHDGVPAVLGNLVERMKRLLSSM